MVFFVAGDWDGVNFLWLESANFGGDFGSGWFFSVNFFSSAFGSGENWEFSGGIDEAARKFALIVGRERFEELLGCVKSVFAAVAWVPTIPRPRYYRTYWSAGIKVPDAASYRLTEEVRSTLYYAFNSFDAVVWLPAYFTVVSGACPILSCSSGFSTFPAFILVGRLKILSICFSSSFLSA